MGLSVKKYQQECLDKLAAYLKRSRELGKPRTAFYELTHRLYQPVLDSRRKTITALEDMPYVCLRVPTGGGKTLMAVHAVKTLLEDWQQREAGLVLWLAPTTKIVEQTINALKDRQHPYRQALDERHKSVQLLDVESALYVKRNTLDAGVTLLVTTMASLRSEDTERRRIFRDDNGMLMDHFTNLTDEQRAALFAQREEGEDPTLPSLQNVIRMRQPVVIVDEAHGFRTDLSFETLRRFNPGCVLEFTATPHEESNVLHSVSAGELKSEDMIKLPVLLRRRKVARDAVLQAVEKRAELEKIALAQEQAGAEYVRPVVLYQAEHKGGELTPENLKSLLVDELHVPKQEVAICIGGKDELPEVSMLSRANQVRHVITVQKLREGWDCPFAYVLCSVGNLSSSQAVEQLIGRILRMPYARRRGDEALNVAYVYAVSGSLQEAAAHLEEAIVESGFSKYEARNAVVASDDEESPLFEGGFEVSVPVTVSPDLSQLREDVREKVKVEQSSAGVRLTWTGGPMSKEAATAVAKMFTNKADQRQVESLRRKTRNQDGSPAGLGVAFRVPGLAVRYEGQRALLEDQPIEAEWDLTAFNHSLSEGEFGIVRDSQQVAEIDVDQRTKTGITMRFRDDMDKMLFAFDQLGPKTEIELAAWLDREIRDHMIIPSQKRIFLKRMVEDLVARRGYSLEELSRHRHRLKESAWTKIVAHKMQVEGRQYQQMLQTVGVDADCSIELPLLYPANVLYEGSFQFQKHYYPDVGTLNGEELAVAKFIDSLPQVVYWARNLERPSFFRFRMPHGYFYPDFVVELIGEYKLVIEHKGAHLEDHDKLKREVGELWEASDTSKSVAFCWTGKTNYQQTITDALKRLGMAT